MFIEEKLCVDNATPAGVEQKTNKLFVYKHTKPSVLRKK
jgi:hypothetical protein